MNKVRFQLPDIYQYFDYRSFLQDAFAQIKNQKSNFTQRHLAAKLGMKSTGHVSWILSGKRNLSEKMIQPLADVLTLNKDEMNFLITLVHFNQAKTHLDKKYFLDKLVSYLKREKKTVQLTQYEMFNKWYYPVVRELVAIYKIKDNYKFLADKIVPHISPQQAKQALKVLDRLGIIQCNRNGYYEQTNKALTAGGSVNAVTIKQFQMDTFDLAKQALDETNAEERDISTLTMSISNKKFEYFKSRIKELREEIIASVTSDDEQEKVYQFNTALFPLSKTKGDE